MSSKAARTSQWDPVLKLTTARKYIDDSMFLYAYYHLPKYDHKFIWRNQQVDTKVFMKIQEIKHSLEEKKKQIINGKLALFDFITNYRSINTSLKIQSDLTWDRV